MGFIKKGAEKVWGGIEDAWGGIKDTADRIVGGLTGETAAEASREAANVQAASQQDALDYLKEREALPTEIRDKALGGLSSLYLGGPEGEQAVQNLQNSAIYQAIMSSMPQAEEAIMRNQAMTGGLRSGNTQEALADTSANIQNQALLQAIGGMERLAGTQTNPGAIANLIGSIGSTKAAGLTGAAQAEQAALGNLMNMGSTAAMMYFMSDRRLKDNITFESKINGVNIYSWDWNDIAENEFGLTGEGMGPIAQEIEKSNPETVIEHGAYKAILTEPFLEVING